MAKKGGTKMKTKIRGKIVHFLYFALIFLSLIFVTACSSDAFNSETKRRNPGIQTPEPMEDSSGASPIPELSCSRLG